LVAVVLGLVAASATWAASATATRDAGPLPPFAAKISQGDRPVRQWYKAEIAKIPFRVDTKLPLREQALQAFHMRNEIKLAARKMMTDPIEIRLLPPPRTFEDIVARARAAGFNGDALWRHIITDASHSNKLVDALVMGKANAGAGAPSMQTPAPPRARGAASTHPPSAPPWLPASAARSNAQ
jgi:hypothetical protein